ncbi:hypothetical protein SO486_13315 [Pseudomonas salmasensis]|uniref:PAAR motif-containing protein n=2 Tax=Pseudomonas TaxID=286 RepID=A0ABU5FHZ3_9PSED|nr:hypothetical protein [Pseudomonas salmasensis]MDY4300955.1 hypothetical protein [Pseudomonas salmasensis]
MYGLLHARAGDRVSCGKDGQIYRIVGGIHFIHSHGRRTAGTLDVGDKIYEISQP